MSKTAVLNRQSFVFTLLTYLRNVTCHASPGAGILEASSQKYASNVVEKILIFGMSHEKEDLINDMLVSDPDVVLVQMVRSQYANYVVQKAITVANPMQREALVNRLKEHRDELFECQFFALISGRFDI